MFLVTTSDYCSLCSAPLTLGGPMRFVHLRKTLLSFSVCFCWHVAAQNPVGVLEGLISDPSGATVSRAEVTVSNSHTGFSTKQRSAGDGLCHFASLPAGEYDL